jgi:cyclopropane-fatty-acyl-phospholipid synthase
MELICRKLMLKPGLTLLDIGCGWGSLVKYAASNFGVQATGNTISLPQKEYAEQASKGLSVTILNQDYRDLPHRQFDRIVSVGMFEHVGYKNYREFLEIVHRHLSDTGIFLLHTIGANVSSHYGDPWITKYIFPNGMLPSIAQISKAMEGLFVMEDWHNFGAYYDLTLMAWHKKFNEHWDELKGQFDDRFRRMWNYYLLSCAGGFRARKLQLWQVVMTKHGLPGGFQRHKGS